MTIRGMTMMAVLAVGAVTEAADDNDYGRAHIGGGNGPIEWVSLLGGVGLDGWEAVDSAPGAWTREGDVIVADASGQEAARLTIGDETWDHYELSVQITPGTSVSALEIHFGVPADGSGFYSLNYLAGWKAMVIHRFDKGKGGTKLDVVNCVLEGGREYDIVLAVRGNSVTSYVDGTLINRLTLPQNPAGGIELALWGRSTTARFRNPQVRHYR